MTAVAVVVALALFLGGIYLLGTAATFVGIESLVFSIGILLVAAAFVIPVHLMKRVD